MVGVQFLSHTPIYPSACYQELKKTKALWLSDHQNHEPTLISLLYKLPSLRYSVIAIENGQVSSRGMTRNIIQKVNSGCWGRMKEAGTRLEMVSINSSTKDDEGHICG